MTKAQLVKTAATITTAFLVGHTAISSQYEVALEVSLSGHWTPVEFTGCKASVTSKTHGDFRFEVTVKISVAYPSQSTSFISTGG